jgi:hypothetical protein
MERLRSPGVPYKNNKEAPMRRVYTAALATLALLGAVEA